MTNNTVDQLLAFINFHAMLKAAQEYMKLLQWSKVTDWWAGVDLSTWKVENATKWITEMSTAQTALIGGIQSLCVVISVIGVWAAFAYIVTHIFCNVRHLLCLMYNALISVLAMLCDAVLSCVGAIKACLVAITVNMDRTIVVSPKVSSICKERKA